MSSAPLISPAQHYSVFGLIVRSMIDLPELVPVQAHRDPDVTIVDKSLPGEPGSPGVTFTEAGVLITITDVGRFLISGGESIVVDALAGVDARNVRLFLLGSAFGALLHQRCLLPLHANAVEIGGRAFAFLGESGAGKSTLAAWFSKRGYRVIADDVCVVDISHGHPLAMPGIPRLRLWRDALDAMWEDPGSFQLSFVSEEREKFDVPVDPGSTVRDPLPLGALYVLGRSETFELQEMPILDSVESLAANTYRGALVNKSGRQDQFWKSVISLAKGLPVFRAGRQWGLSDMDRENGRLLEHATALARGQTGGGEGSSAAQRDGH